MKKNRILVFLIITTVSYSTFGQSSGSITVGADFDKFYPVTWYDFNWDSNKPSEMFIGRSWVHTNSLWRGSLISFFSFHTTQYGNGSSYIDVSMHQAVNEFVAGWRDATAANGDRRIIVWLRGGGTTYYYGSSGNVSPIIYDGVANNLPFNETNGPSHSYKTAIDPYVNSNGNSTVNGFFSGNVCIGTTDPKSFKLAVNGKVWATEVQVALTNPGPDYVFEKNYDLLSLEEIKTYIEQNKHLPEVPSAKEMEANGINLSEMNMLLLKKVEELTLHMIELKRENELQSLEIQKLKSNK